LIGVGILSRNCEETITKVIKAVDEGLNNYFTKQECLIIVCDGFSEDSTAKIAQDTVTRIKKVVLTQKGRNGKGNGVKNIFQLSLEKNCEKLALIDGDLLSITPDWVKKLLYPLREGIDMVIPYYLRHPFDGVITNNIAYPLTTSLYGKEIRQPIGGEFALSRRLAERILRHPLFPEDFGIDIFLSTTALAENFGVIESILGKKEHTSALRYNEPASHLFPMYYQVTRELFTLYTYYEDKIKAVSEIKQVCRYGEISSETTVPPLKIERNKWEELFWQDYKKLYLRSRLKEIFSAQEKEIEKIVEAEEGIYLPTPLWAKILFRALLNYKQSKHQKEILDILRVFWEARYISLLREGEKLNPSEIEEKILSQTEVFWKERQSLL